MIPTLYVIRRDRPARATVMDGRLATMARPRGGDWLAEEIAALRSAGVDVLVSALTESEQVELQLTAEHDLARAAGMEYFSFPILDHHAPAVSHRDLAALVAQLQKGLLDGRFVVVHCRAGIGRSSLIAAAVLVAEGLTPDESWRRVSEARGLEVPDTQSQKDWLMSFATTGPFPDFPPQGPRAF